MFINYMRISLIRIFKGKSAMVSFILTLGYVLAMYIYLGLIFFAIGEDRASLINSNMGIVPFCQVMILGLSFFSIPFITGMVGCGFVANYYTSRSHYNLEIGMRNRTLFCFSQFVSISIISIINLAIAVLGMAALEFFVPSEQSLLRSTNFYIVATYGVMALIGIHDSVSALLCGVLIRKKAKSILLYMGLWFANVIAGFICSEYLPKRYELIGYILFPSFVNWFSGDTPMLQRFSGIRLILIILGFILKIAVMFAVSVVLFNRKVEEKRR